MEVRRALSEWWCIALVSLAAGGLSFLLLSATQNGPPSSFGWFISLAYSWWITFITCVLMTAVPWRPLTDEWVWDPVKLSQAGYEVTARGSDFDLRVAKYSIARIRVRDGKRSYRTLPTSTGFWALFLLCFSSFLSILAFPILLYIYVQCQKGLGTMLPRLKDLPRSSERGVDELMMDSLTSTYMMARQAADAARSRLQDHCIMMVIMALIGSGALLILSVRMPFDADEYAWRLGGGTALLVIIAILGILVLWRRERGGIEEDERWAERLMAVVRGSVPEGGSAVEMLLRACSEVPRWLNVHRKGMWYRRPGMSLLIALLLDQGTIFLIIGSDLDLVRLIGGGLFALGVLLLLDQYRRGRNESDLFKEDWNRKMQEMENALGLMGER